MEKYTKKGKLRISNVGRKPLPPNKKLIQLGAIFIDRIIADDPKRLKSFIKIVKKLAKEEAGTIVLKETFKRIQNFNPLNPPSYTYSDDNLKYIANISKKNRIKIPLTPIRVPVCGGIMPSSPVDKSYDALDEGFTGLSNFG